MAVTPSDIAVELGRPAPDTSRTIQWQTWIDQALYLIGKRLTVANLDSQDVDYVVLQAVVAHVRNPENATQVDVSVDDGNVSKRYVSGNGRVTIPDELWTLLDPDFDDASAFSVTPTFMPDVPVA